MPIAVGILAVFNGVLGLFMFLMLVFRDLAHVEQRGLVPIDYVILPFDIVLTGGYLLAGAGLLMRTKWGYYAHLVMCVLTVLNLPFCCCFGFIYTILGIIVGMKPQVRGWFGFPRKVTPAASDSITLPKERRRDIEFPD